MQIIRELNARSAPLGPLVATIGNFDGVHRGHRLVIESVCRRTRELNAPALNTPVLSAHDGNGHRTVRSAVITFDPHPSRALWPDRPHTLIAPLEQKLALLAETGVDLAIVLPFDRSLATTSARAFAQDILRDRIGVIELHEGENFRFGHNAEADIHTLAQLGEEFGFRVALYPPRSRLGGHISSSRIRELIAAGDVSAARRLLGRPFTIESTPAPGRGYGTRYTVPTINLAPYPELLPGNGVYVTSLQIGSGPAAEHFDAVTNVGHRPTFGSEHGPAPPTVESHLLNFHPIALEETTPLRLTFLLRLRPEIRWPSPEALREQIGRDVARARRFFTLCRAVRPQAPASRASTPESPAQPVAESLSPSNSPAVPTHP